GAVEGTIFEVQPEVTSGASGLGCPLNQSLYLDEIPRMKEGVDATVDHREIALEHALGGCIDPADFVVGSNGNDTRRNVLQHRFRVPPPLLQRLVGGMQILVRSFQLLRTLVKL